MSEKSKWCEVNVNIVLLFIFKQILCGIITCPFFSSDAASSSPADPLCASRGRQLANKLLQRQRRCSRLVNQPCRTNLSVCCPHYQAASFLNQYKHLCVSTSQVLFVQAAKRIRHKIFSEGGAVFIVGERERRLDWWQGHRERHRRSSGQDRGTALLPRKGLLSSLFCL